MAVVNGLNIHVAEKEHLFGSDLKAPGFLLLNPSPMLMPYYIPMCFTGGHHFD